MVKTVVYRAVGKAPKELVQEEGKVDCRFLSVLGPSDCPRGGSKD